MFIPSRFGCAATPNAGRAHPPRGSRGSRSWCRPGPLLVLVAGLMTCLPAAEEDPLFGPWYGVGSLPTKQTTTHVAATDADLDLNSPAKAVKADPAPTISTNLLPVDAGKEGVQNWLYVGNWKVNGPFPNGEWNEKSPAQPTDFTATTGPTAWRPPGLAEANGNIWAPLWDWKYRDKYPVPFMDQYGRERTSFFATTIVQAEQDVELPVAVGADDRAKVWVNGQLVGQSPAKPSDTGRNEDHLRLNVRFAKGENRIVVCCQNDERLSYFWLRVCVRGRPQPAAGQAQAKAIAKRIASFRAGSTGYRNDSRNSYPEAKPVTTWDGEQGTNIRWRVPLFAPSKSAPLIVGDRVFTLLDGGVLVCLDKLTGRILWEGDCVHLESKDKARFEETQKLCAAYRTARDRVLALGNLDAARLDALKKEGLADDAAKAKLKDLVDAAEKAGLEWRDAVIIKSGFARKFGGWLSMSGFSLPSPVTDGKLVWVRNPLGVVACFDLAGKRLWTANVEPASSSVHHLVSSPALVTGTAGGKGRALLILRLPNLTTVNGKSEEAKTHTILALDAATGAVAWKIPNLDGISYTATPVVVRLSNGDSDLEVILTQTHAKLFVTHDGNTIARTTVLRADDGKILIDGLFADSDIGMPTVAGDIVYMNAFSSLKKEFPDRTTAHQLIMLDRDTVGAKLLWSRQSAFGRACPGGLTLHKGLLYGVTGAQDCQGLLVLDAATGIPVAAKAPTADRLKGRPYLPTTGAGDYIFAGDNGTQFRNVNKTTIWVLKPYPDGEIVGRNTCEAGMLAPPVFDGDRMYLRTESHLTCVAAGDGKP